ncbi:unnamed protein product, partial [marine sediment metagenome]
MAKPWPNIFPPSHFYPDNAFFHGMCRDMGGLPTQFCFTYRNNGFWRSTPWRDVDHDGQEFDERVFGLNFVWAGHVKAWAKNADGSVMTSAIRFWLPKPTAPKLGAPWLILRQAGAFRDMIYDWGCHTDIGCLLHLLVGERKPYISPTVHITRGVVFHHDAELWFRWLWRINSDQTVD